MHIAILIPMRRLEQDYILACRPKCMAGHVSPYTSLELGVACRVPRGCLASKLERANVSTMLTKILEWERITGHWHYLDPCS